uniref:Uncharacterized protein n=1 Tax=Onchocerca volvulus TaxID=6282 RepID=A0A8R1XL12_ONCVO
MPTTLVGMLVTHTQEDNMSSLTIVRNISELIQSKVMEDQKRAIYEEKNIKEKMNIRKEKEKCWDEKISATLSIHFRNFKLSHLKFQSKQYIS